MNENDVGVVVTREFELPFVPKDGLSLYSREWEQCPDPQGMILKDVVWDVDRQVFLATTHQVSVDFPIACIPSEIRSWLDKGWSWGSYMDRYEGDDTSKAPRRSKVGEFDDPADTADGEFEEKLHQRPAKERPAGFNRFFKSLIRHMVSTYSSLETAYAMDKMDRYLGRERGQACDNAAREQWEEALCEHKRLSNDERWKWMKRVERSYPKLASVVLGEAAKRARKNGETSPS